jgi:hypothetical protein
MRWACGSGRRSETRSTGGKKHQAYSGLFILLQRRLRLRLRPFLRLIRLALDRFRAIVQGPFLISCLKVSYPSTRGLPVYITSANTFIPAVGVPPAQNYPRGWLSSALSMVNSEPQIQALCWFLNDLHGDTQWENFSLTRRRGRLVDAA